MTMWFVALGPMVNMPCPGSAHAIEETLSSLSRRHTSAATFWGWIVRAPGKRVRRGRLEVLRVKPPAPLPLVRRTGYQAKKQQAGEGVGSCSMAACAPTWNRGRPTGAGPVGVGMVHYTWLGPNQEDYEAEISGMGVVPHSNRATTRSAAGGRRTSGSSSSASRDPSLNKKRGV
mmetsp:Transcript_58594/g.154865  ORF Transcript_58594/g.154865 Transcript_58594/m.154865 type:complete len:174 (-) Transcript_58594:216-737(-)